MPFQQNQTNISQTLYVEQTTIIQDSDAAGTKNLCTRLFTTNQLMPTDSWVFYSNANQVGAVFGIDSEEYKRAVFYFSFTAQNRMNNYRVPDLISFAKYTPDPVPARIFGAPVTAPLSTFHSITNGSFGITIDEYVIFQNLDFSSVTSYSDVAAVIQAAMNNYPDAGQYQNCTVVFDSTRGSFNFASGLNQASTVSVESPPVGTPIQDYIGWNTSATYSNGSNGSTITETLVNSFNANDDFASFLFMPGLDLTGTIEAAQWVSNTVKPNFSCSYLIPIVLEDAQTWYDALVGYTGLMATVKYETTPQYEEMIPGAIAAASDYTQNTLPNYKYQICNLIPTVTNNANATFLNSLGINYVGRTKKSTTTQEGLIFYQNGVMIADSDSVNNLTNQMTVYFNEVWFKATLQKYFLDLLTSRSIPADNEGVTIVTGTASQVVTLALNNGVIQSGKDLTDDQKAFVAQITGNPTAYRNITLDGYYQWVTFSGANASYNIIYSSRGLIQQILGFDVII
jgi:hypothetical protein